MRVTKKVISWISIIAVLFTLTVAPVAAQTPEIVIESLVVNIATQTDAGVVTVSGNTADKQPAARLTVRVLNPIDPEISSEALTTLMSTGDANTIYNYLGETVTDSEGAFSFKFKLKDGSAVTGETAKYMLVLDGAGYDFAYQSFNYADASYIETNILDLINGGSVASIKEAVKNYRHSIVNLPILDDPGINADGVIDVIAQALFDGKPYADSTALVAAAEEAGVLGAMTNTSSFDLFKSIVNTYNHIAGLPLDNATLNNSAIFDEEAKNSVLKGMFDKRVQCDTFGEYADVLKEEILLGAIANITAPATLLTELKNFEAVIAGGDTDVADKLDDVFDASTEKQIAFAGSVLSEEPSSITALRSIIESYELSTSVGGNSPVGGATGGGGTGGGGGRVSSQATYVPPAISEVASAFNDIDSVLWAKQSIINLVDRGIIDGYGNTFRPMNDITRAEFTKIIVVAFDLYDDAATCGYIDVMADHWAYRYIASAKNAGIVKGVNAYTFGVDEKITREDMATIIYRVITAKNPQIGVNAQEGEFTDADRISDYAVDAVNAMKRFGIINGYEDGSFRPKNNATRAEAAKIIDAVLSIIE